MSNRLPPATLLFTLAVVLFAIPAQAQTYSIGDRVWFDTDNSGTINGAEGGVDGVHVSLYAANDLTVAIATDITSGGGSYLFNGITAGDYVVAIDADNFNAGVLIGSWSAGTSRTDAGAIVEATAPDADDDVDSDDNGMLQSGGTLNGAVISSVITIAADNATVDFAFYRIRIGNQVWNDVNNDGLLNNGENGYNAVTVELRSADGTALLDTTTTSGNGNYEFDGLPAGDYLVRLPAINFNPGGVLRDYRSSTGLLPTIAYEPAPDPDLDTADSDDNGTEANGLLGLGGYIQSAVVTLTPGAEQSTDASGTTDENRVDFGVNSTPQIDLVVTKTDGQSSYVPGETLQYVIVVTNNGPADANGMTVNDTRPSQIGSWTWTCAPGTPAAYNCTDDASNPVTFTDSLDLPQLGSVTYNVTAQVDPVVNGDLSNMVYVVPPSGMTDMTNADNIATDTDALNAVDLSVTKSDGQETYTPGETLNYTIVVTNNGPADANGMTISDARPAQIASWTWTCDASTPPAYNCSSDAANPATFTDSLDLPTSASVTYHVTAQVASTVSGDLTNTAQVFAPSATPELEPVDNIASDTDALQAVDLSVTKTDGQSTYSPAGTVTYTIVVTNNGPADANGMSITDARPAQIASWTWTCDASTPPAYQCSSDASNPATFTDSLDLPASADVTYHVTAQIADVVTGDLTNSVQVSAPGDTPELNALDNTATDVDTLGETSLAIAKTASPNPVPAGGVLAYTIEVSNTGSVNATNLTVTDPLPPSVTYLNATGDGWSCSESANTVTCTRALLEPGNAPPIVITVQVSDARGTLTNTATVASGNAGASAATAQAQVSRTVPALSDFGLAAFGAFIAVAGALLLRR